MAAIEGENDHFPLGEVPGEWLQKRILGVATTGGEYADICSSKWISRGMVCGLAARGSDKHPVNFAEAYFWLCNGNVDAGKTFRQKVANNLTAEHAHR